MVPQNPGEGRVVVWHMEDKLLGVLFCVMPVVLVRSACSEVRKAILQCVF